MKKLLKRIGIAIAAFVIVVSVVFLAWPEAFDLLGDALSSGGDHAIEETGGDGSEQEQGTEADGAGAASDDDAGAGDSDSSASDGAASDDGAAADDGTTADPTPSTDDDASSQTTDDGTSEQAPAPTTSDAPAPSSRTYTAFDPSASPDYYRVVGSALVDRDVPEGAVYYSELDSLGRAGQCVANVTHAMMKESIARERQDMLDLYPSGWGHNTKVDITYTDGYTSHVFFYNRSHLVAKSLGGEERIENIVTGTKCQNTGNGKPVGGMAYTENLARKFIAWHHECTLWYSATPVYEGNELVPRSVIVDMKSSDGSIDLEIEVYNAVNGYAINYATGEFSAN